MLLLGELTSNNWHVGVKLFIAVLIIGLGVMCVIFKVMFVAWLYRLEKKLNNYLQSLNSELENPDHNRLQVCTYKTSIALFIAISIMFTYHSNTNIQFPYCDDESAISVSCLNLSYFINFKENKALKDERNDTTVPIVLCKLEEDDSDTKPVDGEYPSLQVYSSP